jgi:Mrp family chromosome partitioning ATPase
MRPSRREGVQEGLAMLLAVIAACTAGAVALTLLRGQEYESTAVVRTGAPLDGARSPEVARRALDAAGARGEPAAALLDHSEVDSAANGQLSFTVRADEPRAARVLAASYARAYTGSAPRVRPAEPTREIPPAALLGAGIGLLLGLVLALIREALDVRRTSSRTVAARLGTKEIGRVPDVPEALEDSFTLAAREASEGGSPYGHVAAALAEEASEAAAKLLVVAGTVSEDNAEQVAPNLAVALAELGHTVAVVELDPGRPVLRRFFALERGPGLAEVLRDEVALDDALARVPDVGGLAVLTAGHADSPAGEPANGVLDALGATFDYVLVCGTPLLRRGHAPMPRADALVLAVHLHRVRHSRRPRLERLLRGLGIPVLGFVLVGGRERAPVVSGALARSRVQRQPSPQRRAAGRE